MKFLNLSIFDPSNAELQKDIIIIAGFVIVIALVNITFIWVFNRIIGSDQTRNWRHQLVGFLMTGGVAGGALAFALFEIDPWAIGQGIAGGVVAACLIGLMVPKRLSAEMTATLEGQPRD
jgi:hypothetical protein